MIWSPMLSWPHLAEGPLGDIFARTTVGTIEPQPDSTITTPSSSPFILGTITYKNYIVDQAWPWGYKTFFMLNSADHEICHANKY